MSWLFDLVFMLTFLYLGPAMYFLGTKTLLAWVLAGLLAVVTAFGFMAICVYVDDKRIMSGFQANQTSEAKPT